MAKSLFTELKRRNVWKVSVAYMVLAWVVVQVTSVAVPALHLPDWVNSFVFYIGVIGFPFALFLAWAYEITPEGIRKESDLRDGESHRIQTGQILDYIIIGLLAIALGYFIYESRFLNKESDQSVIQQVSQTDEQQQITESPHPEEPADDGENVITLAVLPLVNMSDDEAQEYFTDGLTEELHNALTRVDGLKITGRTSSFEFKNKNIDLREIAKKLDVDYLIEGSVRKSDEDIRVTIQLIESENGTHLFSEIFTRKLVDVFALQEDISNQVAAALNLTLVLKDERYHSALSTLDYLAVEKLVKARALVGEYAEAPVKQAYDMLKELNQQYPKTPEIMGLLAFSLMIHSSVGETILLTEQEIQLAEETLKLDRKNKDALITLAVIYDDFPQYYEEAYDVYQDLIRYYPAEATSYTQMLSYMFSMHIPCEELQLFLDSIPKGVLNVDKKRQYDFVVMQCLTPVLAEKYLATLADKSIAEQSLFLTSASHRFKRRKELFDKNPNQRHILGYYERLLAMGATKSAEKVAKKIDFSLPGIWSLHGVLAGYIHDVKVEKKPFTIILDIEKILGNPSHPIVSLSLSKQALSEEKTEQLHDYLDNVSDFPIAVNTSSHSLGLIALQYFAGEKQLSQQTAKQLYDELTQYKNRHPASFEYWQLYWEYLITAFYSGNEDQASKILYELFPDDADYGFRYFKHHEFALSPWKDHPVAIELLKRMKTDQQRLLEKYDLK